MAGLPLLTVSPKPAAPRARGPAISRSLSLNRDSLTTLPRREMPRVETNKAKPREHD